MQTHRPLVRVALLCAAGALRLFILLGFAIAGGLAPLARADSASNLADLSLEQLMDIQVETVFSASKYQQKITRAPASVTIVSADDIAALGHRTLADILRSTRGLYVSDDNNYSYVGARGFLRPGDYNTRMLLLVDGHRINDNVYDSAYYGRDAIVDVDVIDRVEIIRGPSSSIYGNSAFFGVINVVTKTGHQLDGTEVSGEIASFGTTQARVSYGKKFSSGLDLFLSASTYHSDGRSSLYYPEFDQRLSSEPRAANNGVAARADAEEAFNFQGTATFRDFTLSTAFASRSKTIPTASFLTVFNTDREWTRDTRGYVDLQFRHELTPDTQLTLRGFYDYYTYVGDYPFPSSPPDAPGIYLNKDDTLGDDVGLEGQLTTTFAGRHTLVTGFEFRDNLHERQLNYDDVVPRLYITNTDQAERTAALYAQGEFTLAPALLLNAGLRYDHYYDDFGGTLNPRLGLIYTPRERTTLKALYGRAFRAPNDYEQFYVPPPVGVVLEPEHISTYELDLEHYFTRYHRLSVSLYRYQITDLINQAADPAGNVYFANLDRASARGVEFELEGKYAAGIRARASWAFQRTRDDATGQELSASPRQLGKLSLICPFANERFTAALELQYQSSLRTLAGNPSSSFILTNLTLAAHQLTPRLTISASLYNLFDEHYTSPGAEEHLQDVLPQPGRTFLFKLTYKL